MLRNFILVILAAIAISACSQSLLKEGIYTDIGGSEKLISINLLVSGEFILNHETWQPGHYEDRQSVVTKGEWVFNNKNLMLNIDNQTYIADLVTIGKNPLGVDENTRVLHFLNNPANEKINLNNEILYPQE